MSERKLRISFIGTGVMGGPMAGHLVKAGHHLTVYNRTRTKADAWVAQHGGAAAATPAEAARDADVVLTCVGNDDDLAQVTLGRDGAFKAMREGALFVDHTTVSARIARQLSVEADGLGLLCVDAPVSGGEAGAQNGTLAIMCGGSKAAFEAAAPVMQAYAARMVHIGGPGAGQTTKMVNQIAIAGVVQGLSEALRFAQASKLDTDKIFEAVSGGAAASWQMLNRWARWRTTSSTSASRSTGCARTSASRSTKRASTARRCRSPASSTNSTPMCKRRAAGARIPARS